MKNAPNKIFLNIGTDEKDLDFNNLSEITWSDGRIYKDDLEFVSSNFILSRIERLREVVGDTREGLNIINELKNLLK